MRTTFYNRNGKRTALIIQGVLVDLCLARYQTVEALRTRVRLLAENTPEGETPGAWVRDQLILEVAKPELVRNLGDEHNMAPLPFKGFIHL